MIDIFSRIYYPLSVPVPHHARHWRKLHGYDDAPVVDDPGSFPVVHYRFKSTCTAAAGKKILFFSDLHYSGTEPELEDEFIELIKDIAPDLMLCGGDMVREAVCINVLPAFLRRMADCVPCCITVPGNWERGKVWLKNDFWQEFFASGNWHFLCNEDMEIGGWCWIYGVDDLSKGFPMLPEFFPEGRENIMLTHRPDTVVALDCGNALCPFSLALCGHTHGGQIRLPFIGALTVPSYYRTKFASGMFQRKNFQTRMIVSTGVNHASFPWRLNCRREVILIEFG